MSFPPAHALIGAGLAEVATATRPLPRWRAWTLAAFLAVSPDFDIAFGLLVGRGASMHGTFSHSITATVIMTLAWFAIGGGRRGRGGPAGGGAHPLGGMLGGSGGTNLGLGGRLPPPRRCAPGPRSPTGES